jgi:hypothetical protein
MPNGTPSGTSNRIPNGDSNKKTNVTPRCMFNPRGLIANSMINEGFFIFIFELHKSPSIKILAEFLAKFLTESSTESRTANRTLSRTEFIAESQTFSQTGIQTHDLTFLYVNFIVHP